MQKCKSCGKEIRWIATGRGESVMCEVKEITVFTANGRKLTAYEPHNCKDKENENHN